MLKRRPRANSPSEALPGRPQLTLATLIVFAEATLRAFARPLFFALLFLGLAWVGAFAALYPWAHLVALVLFVMLLADALGRATVMWQRPSLSLAMRRVEEASGLKHRPMDVVGDHPAYDNADTYTLWQEHVLRARAQMKKLRWPEWKMDWSARDPYRLRYVAVGFVLIGLVAGWGALGGRMIAAINPALGRAPIAVATLDVWVTPPDYTHMPPIMIATPAGARFQGDTIKIPEGSVLHAHVVEKDDATPVLSANDQEQDFTAEDDKDYGATVTLTRGDELAISRGWSTLAKWKVEIVPDTAPQIAFSENPSASERKDVRVAYDAHDDYGVTSVTLRMTPREAMFGLNADPVDYPLASVDDKELKRVDYKDLTALPWAGRQVDLQLIATDAVGHKAESAKIAMILPERDFYQPVARMLIEERKKLLGNLLGNDVRVETANLMAGLAHQPASFGNDQVVMMALRAGAVRLVLDRGLESALAAKDTLWQAAVRIEDGSMGVAEQALKQAQKDLADALDRNADEKEVQAKLERLHQALAQYLSQLSTRTASRPSTAEDLRQILGNRTNSITPQDLEKMMKDMRDMSASGQREDLRQKLAKLQDILENLRTSTPPMTAEQMQALQNYKDMRDLAKDQQALMDNTFQKSQSGNRDGRELSKKQGDLQKRLQALMNKTGSMPELGQGNEAMTRAEGQLKQGGMDKAGESQGEALKALQKAGESMAQKFREGASGAMAGMNGGRDGHDPFGRDEGDGLYGETANPQVTEKSEAQRVREILNEIQKRAGELSRPKIERDYIERLLQNF